jgi:Xaa-Pro aminopeptidase
VLRKSVAISTTRTKRACGSRAGQVRDEVEAAIEAVYMRNGAMSWGYPSIVGSGPNSTILHYNKSSRRMEAGDLLLVDAAGSYQGYTGTLRARTQLAARLPRNRGNLRDRARGAGGGHESREGGSRTTDIQAACDDVLRAGPCGWGSSRTPGQQSTSVNPWRLSLIGSTCTTWGPRPLAPGMAFVIEPGIYIRDAALDNLPKTPRTSRSSRRFDRLSRSIEIAAFVSRFVSADGERSRAALGRRAEDRRRNRALHEAAGLEMSHH